MNLRINGIPNDPLHHLIKVKVKVIRVKKGCYEV